TVLPTPGYTLNSPSGLAIESGTGNLFVANSGADTILKIAPTGQLITTWGEGGNQLGAFHSPEGIAVDDVGNVYVADKGNHRIQELDPRGTPLATWGSQGTGWGQFCYPRGIAVDTQLNLWVADTSNSRIVKILH